MINFSLLKVSNEEEYWIYLGDDTSDITGSSIIENWDEEKSVWDEA